MWESYELQETGRQNEKMPVYWRAPCESDYSTKRSDSARRRRKRMGMERLDDDVKTRRRRAFDEALTLEGSGRTCLKPKCTVLCQCRVVRHPYILGDRLLVECRGFLARAVGVENGDHGSTELERRGGRGKAARPPRTVTPRKSEGASSTSCWLVSSRKRAP